MHDAIGGGAHQRFRSRAFLARGEVIKSHRIVDWAGGDGNDHGRAEQRCENHWLLPLPSRAGIAGAASAGQPLSGRVTPVFFAIS